jgi:hypothetical protein
MRALNLGFLAVAGALGALASCGDPEQPAIEPGGQPFPTGGRPVTSTPTGGTGGTIGSGGATTKGTSGGQTSAGGSPGCPMNEPDDGDSCTLPASGMLKCTFTDTTCQCMKAFFGGKATWDCRSSTSSSGGRSSSGGSGGGAGRG